MPSGDPLGLKGYCSVSLPSGLQYLHAAPIADHISTPIVKPVDRHEQACCLELILRQARLGHDMMHGDSRATQGRQFANLIGARPWLRTSCCTAASGNLTRPSPCAHHTPTRLPPMPFSMIAGEPSLMATVAHRHSNLQPSWSRFGEVL